MGRPPSPALIIYSYSRSISHIHISISFVHELGMEIVHVTRVTIIIESVEQPPNSTKYDSEHQDSKLQVKKMCVIVYGCAIYRYEHGDLCKTAYTAYREKTPWL